MHSTRLDSARKRAESVDSLSSRRPEHSLSENLHGRIGEHRNNTQQTVWVCDDAMRHGIALMPRSNARRLPLPLVGLCDIDGGVAISWDSAIS